MAHSGPRCRVHRCCSLAHVGALAYRGHVVVFFLSGAIHELHYATCIVCMPCVARIAVEMSSVVLTEKPVVAMYV